MLRKTPTSQQHINKNKTILIDLRNNIESLDIVARMEILQETLNRLSIKIKPKIFEFLKFEKVIHRLLDRIIWKKELLI